MLCDILSAVIAGVSYLKEVFDKLQYKVSLSLSYVQPFQNDMSRTGLILQVPFGQII